MFGPLKYKLLNVCTVSKTCVIRKVRYMASTVQLPDSADVVVIGGGSAGCNALYHLGKCGVKAVLLEKSKLIAGTTWHTGGLVWSMRGPSDVEMELLATTRKVVSSLETETGVNPGWIKNGGLYIAHTDERLDEYKRLVTAGKAFGIDAQIISPREAKKLFPLLDEDQIKAAVYSVEDGGIDPSMLVNALTKSAKNNGCQIFEDCSVTKILTKETISNNKKVCGVETPYGIIKTDIVLNAAGVWSKNIAKMVDMDIPLTPMKHAYIITEPIKDVQKFPNVRAADISLYFRMQGNTIIIGAYETNPEMLPAAPENFSFSLYDLNWNIFNTYIESTMQFLPELSKTGIKSTICGPESFTPDHKPIMGEDPRCAGLFYSCGYNSAGMMLGGGCGEQIAHWIVNGRPNKYMFNYDIRRFIPEQRSNSIWMNQRSYEAYVKNYGAAFSHDQPLSGRNLKTDPFHAQFVEQGAIMEECQGWERPGWFLPSKKIEISRYDRNKSYDETKLQNADYLAILQAEYNFDISPYDNIIREEALACRNNIAMFDMSNLGKFYLSGPDAQKAADYLFTANTNCELDRTVYTCMLNHEGGVEADCTVTVMGSGEIVNPTRKERAFYIVSSSMSAYHTWSHMNKIIVDQNFNVSLHDITDQVGILSVQGPNSRHMIEDITKDDVSDEAVKHLTTKIVNVQGEMIRLIRMSFVGELGFELHVPKSACQSVFAALMNSSKQFKTKLAGHRALNSLSCEKGYLLWGLDVRNDDNPIEAGLGFTCRRTGEYLGKTTVDSSRKLGVKKRLVRLRLNSATPLWGLETIYRNDCLVGYLRRAEQGYTSGHTIGHGYVRKPDGGYVTKEFLQSGNYEIEVMGKRHAVDLR